MNASASPLVMVAASTEAALRLYASHLQPSGCVIVTANSMEDLARRLETMPELPAVIVLDIPMRRTTDLDALRRVQANRYTGAVPMIFLDGGESPNGASSASFAAVLPKPVTASQLLEVISRLSSR